MKVLHAPTAVLRFQLRKALIGQKFDARLDEHCQMAEAKLKQRVCLAHFLKSQRLFWSFLF